MDPVGILATIRNWLWLIIVGTLLGAVISFGVALVTPPTYVSHVTLLISPPAKEGGVTLSDVEVTQAIAPTFAELTTTTPLLERVITDTGVGIDPQTLGKAVTTHVPVGTSLIDIGVANGNPNTAAALANAIARELQAYAADAENQALVLQVTLTVVDPAVRPTTPDGFGVPVRTALGAAIALFLAISLAFFIENLGRGIRGVGGRLGSATPAPKKGGDDGQLAWPSPERAPVKLWESDREFVPVGSSSHAHRIGPPGAPQPAPMEAEVAPVDTLPGLSELPTRATRPPANRKGSRRRPPTQADVVGEP